MTVINQEAAERRLNQGLFYLLGATSPGREGIDAEAFLSIVTVMAYLGAYAFPQDNLFDLRRRLVGFLDPWKNSADVGAVVERAVDLAEVFRRPWSEPQGPGRPTI